MAVSVVNSFVISRVDYCNTKMSPWSIGVSSKCVSQAALWLSELRSRHLTGFLYHSVFSLNCVCWLSNHFVEWHLDTSSIFAIRRLGLKLDMIFGLRHMATFVFARCTPSLATVLSLLLVHVHGTSSQRTFDLVTLSNLLNVNLSDIYFVSPMVFNLLLSIWRVADVSALVITFHHVMKL